ncbi:MAG: ECF-type sigma factor [Phycisphaerales bacterium]
MTRLEELNPRHARLVELRFFGGLTLEEAAHVMNLSLRTANRDWQVARAWLLSQMAGHGS